MSRYSVGYHVRAPWADFLEMLYMYSVHCLHSGLDKVTSYGWPLLTVETEVNGDSKCTNERGPFLVGSLGLSCRHKKFLFLISALAALVGPVQNVFFLTVHYFNAFVLAAQQAGQAAVLGRLSLSVCLW
jgi:hypothetical protein